MSVCFTIFQPETYRIVYSVTSARGLVYFDINTATSEIFIKRDLAEDTSSLNGQYIVRIYLSMFSKVMYLQ